MKGIIKFKDGHFEDILKHIGFEEAGIFVTQTGTYMRSDVAQFYRYLKDFDMWTSCDDIVDIELEEE
jgi:hypothetical protein